MELQARGNFMEKAVKMLAKRDMSLFATTVRIRICRGKGNEGDTDFCQDGGQLLQGQY